MNVTIMCDSLLLKKALEMILADYITTFKKCDFVITDKKIPNLTKPQFIIANEEYANLKKPFSISQILIELEKFHKKQKLTNQVSNLVKENIEEKSEHLLKLETKIKALTNGYVNKLMQVIKEHYENRE
ncbi:MAG: hypothetical protein HXX81_04785 [Campylobacterales bacterium]|nr:hypothetical protein [Campylobacterales bacterium]